MANAVLAYRRAVKTLCALLCSEEDIDTSTCCQRQAKRIESRIIARMLG